MDLPEFLLEEVFSYLSWNDRARAARVCRKWYSVFKAPSLWRRIVFEPPTRSMTRLEYDMKGYYMSCCLRNVGCYIREYRFVGNEDIFLLNRTLSLVAKFLEAHPPKIPEQCPSRQRHHSTCLEGVPTIETENDLGDSDSTESTSNDEGTNPSSHPLDLDDLEDDHGEMVAGTMNEEEQRLASYLGIVAGDPDAEATLKLILKLQQRELFGTGSSSSSSDTSDEENFMSMLQNRSAAMSISETRSVWPPTTTQPPRKAPTPQRSQSCRYPRYHHARHAPPIVRGFILDFQCEVDELRWFVYGTGGALLSTIRRVLRQLVQVRRLRLTDLFLAITDARNLVLDVAKASSSTLHNLNLVHFYKPWTDHNQLASITSRFSSGPVQGSGHAIQAAPYGLDDDWYLLDSRWLGARPRRLQHNPLADLASLFPGLRKLSLAITQLTGPMLLRLLYQTNLSELCLVQTDFTPFSLSPMLEAVVDQESFQARPPLAHSASLDDESSEPTGCHPHDEFDDDLIDWGEDVPHFRNQLTSNVLPWVMSAPWEPIRVAMWTAALVLRPALTVQFHCLFTRTGFDNSSRLDQLVTLWPQPSVPVNTFVFRTTHGVRWSAACLSLKNPINLASYSTTLTTLVLWIDDDSTSVQLPSESKSNKNNPTPELQDLNDHLHDAIALCSRLSFVAFGGSFPYLYLITLMRICRQRARRQSLAEGTLACAQPFALLVERNSCLLMDPPPTHALPATVQAWYSTVLEAGLDPVRRARAAEQRISDALGQPRWHFLTSGEFESHVSQYFD